MDQYSKNNTSSVIGLAIEKALHNLGPGEFEKVVKNLQSYFHAYLFDSFDNPQYLKKILYSLYPNEIFKVLNLIEKELIETHDLKSVQNFINYMKNPNF